MSCGAETEANALLTSLVAGEDFSPITYPDLSDAMFTVPGDENSPAYGIVQKLTIDDLTQATIAGSGAFDTLMKAVKAHLTEEFKANRITGAEYTKAYVALVTAAMQTGVSFVLGKDQAYWNAVSSQSQAIQGKLAVEAAKIQVLGSQYDTSNKKAEFALTKMKLSTESAQYCTLQYNLTNILPAQWGLVLEQKETARAQTLDTRSDGTVVAGSVGKQKTLLDQQVTSYKTKDLVDTSKLFTEAWTVQKTVDDATLPPENYTNAEVDNILDYVRTQVGYPARS